MYNSRKLYVSLITSVMLIAMVTIVAADDATLTPETAAQNAGEVILCLDEKDLQEETPLSSIAVMGLEKEENVSSTDAEDKTAAESNESILTEESEKKENNEAGSSDTNETPADETTREVPAAESGSIPENVSWEEPEADCAVTTTSADIWVQVYEDLMYGEQTVEKLALLEQIEAKQYELSLMSCSTDHIVNYHGTKYAISDDEYQVLLRIVESEAPCEDIEGRMLVANVVLNRVHADQFPDTISEVVFQKGQFAPVSDGMYYRRKVSEKTIEAVERVLAGEDNSQGALYFVARALASKEGLRFFDEKLEKLFKHGVHTFYAEK